MVFCLADGAAVYDGERDETDENERRLFTNVRDGVSGWTDGRSSLPDDEPRRAASQGHPFTSHQRL